MRASQNRAPTAHTMRPPWLLGSTGMELALLTKDVGDV